MLESIVYAAVTLVSIGIPLFYISPAALKEVAHRRSLLLRRRTFLNAVNSVFDPWHVVHKPFAWVAILIMFLHIILVAMMGYRWIF